MKKPSLKKVGALTIIQPWAHVILKKGKNVENRRRTSHYRGTIAIHASKKNSKEYFDDCSTKVQRESVPFGAVVGFAELVDVITKKDVTSKTKNWFQGKYGYVLENVVALKEPVYIKKGGRQVWTLSGPDLKACLKQLSPAQLKRLKPFEKISKKTRKSR